MVSAAGCGVAVLKSDGGDGERTGAAGTLGAGGGSGSGGAGNTADAAGIAGASGGGGTGGVPAGGAGGGGVPTGGAGGQAGTGGAGTGGAGTGGCAASTANACGGCAALTAAPNAACGTCGKYICSTDKSSVTCSDPGANACGGCGTLAAAPSVACGTCGKYVCSTDKSSVTCSDPGANACGGCGTLTAAPNTACGTCGKYVCNSAKTAVTCSDPGANACGGCGTLTAAPNSACGTCGKYVCNSAKTAVTCSDPGPCTMDRTGLVAEYLFNGNANDTSGQGHNATSVTAVLTSDRAGTANGAYEFNGTDSIIAATGASDLNLSASSSQLTLEAWVFPTAKKTQIVVRLGAGVNGAAASPYELSMSATGDLIGGLQSASGLKQVRLAGYALNSWTHMALTWNGSTMTLFVNGKAAATMPFSETLNTNTNPLLIGTRLQLPADTFQGKLEDIRLFSVARTQAQICLDAGIKGTTDCP